MQIAIATLNDVADILAIYKPYVEKTNITFEYTVPTLEVMSQRMNHILQDYPYLVAKINHQVVGYAYAARFRERKAFDWCCELSIYVDDNYHHQGIAKALYEALFNILTMMNIQTVYACITHPNLKSENFHRHFGFQQNALFEKNGYKFQQWHDVIWMQKSLGNYQNVRDVIPFVQLDRKKVEACLKK